MLAGDYNVMPTELDVYKPERWVDDACSGSRSARLPPLAAQGWTDALRTLHPGERIYTFWDYFRNAYARDAGLRIDHLLLSPSVAARLKAPASTATCAAGKRRATTRRSGSSLRMARPSSRSEKRGDRHGRGRKSSAQAAQRAQAGLHRGTHANLLGSGFSVIRLSTRARAPPAHRRSRRAPALPLRR